MPRGQYTMERRTCLIWGGILSILILLINWAIWIIFVCFECHQGCTTPTDTKCISISTLILLLLMCITLFLLWGDTKPEISFQRVRELILRDLSDTPQQDSSFQDTDI